MQENNFEKAVQQKLNGLHLTPSEPVWQRLEASIKKKRERRFIFWLLPLLLLTAGLAWWGLKTMQQENAVAAKPAEVIEQTPTFSKPHARTKNKEAAVAKPATLNTPAAKDPVVENGQAKSNGASGAKLIADRIRHNHKIQPASNKIALDNKNGFVEEASHSRAETEMAVQSLRIPQRVTTIATQQLLKRNEAAAVPPVKAAANRIEIDTKALPQTGKPAVQTKRKPVQWYVTGRIGASNISDDANFFSLAANKSNNDAFEFSSAPLNGNPNRFDANSTQSSLFYTKGLQASIGAGIKKAIGKRSFLVTGLQYSFYHNEVTAAPQWPADSIARSLYNSMQNASGAARIVSRYANTFHFVELPVGLEHRLLKSGLLHLQYGIAVSQLLSGEVLRYDDDKNIYRQDADGVRQTGLALYATVDYTVWKGRGFSVHAGPHVQYGLRNSFKNTATEDHLVSGGLAVTMGF